MAPFLHRSSRPSRDGSRSAVAQPSGYGLSSERSRVRWARSTASLPGSTIADSRTMPPTAEIRQAFMRVGRAPVRSHPPAIWDRAAWTSSSCTIIARSPGPLHLIPRLPRRRLSAPPGSCAPASRSAASLAELSLAARQQRPTGLPAGRCALVASALSIVPGARGAPLIVGDPGILAPNVSRAQHERSMKSVEKRRSITS